MTVQSTRDDGPGHRHAVRQEPASFLRNPTLLQAPVVGVVESGRKRGALRSRSITAPTTDAQPRQRHHDLPTSRGTKHPIDHAALFHCTSIRRGPSSGTSALACRPRCCWAMLTVGDANLSSPLQPRSVRSASMRLQVLLYLVVPLAVAIPVALGPRDATTTLIVDGNPLACTSGDVGIDPSIPSGYINQFCSLVSASQPDWLIEVTGLPQGNVNLLYAWEAAGKDYSQPCSTPCADAFNDIIQNCEYDSHDIDGVGTYTEACGQFILEITAG